jgi:hypothetical protein
VRGTEFLDWLGARWASRWGLILLGDPAAAHTRELRDWAASALSLGKPAEVEAYTWSVMAARVDTAPAGEPYLTAWRFRAQALGQLGRHAEAARELTGLIDTVSGPPGNRAAAELWRCARAVQLTYLGRYDGAGADCRTAIEQAPRSVPRFLPMCWSCCAAI